MVTPNIFIPPLIQPLVGEPKEGPSIAGFHKIVDYMRCPTEYRFKHVIGIKHKETGDKAALAIGVLAHVGRATWFASQFRCSVDAIQQSISEHVKKFASPANIGAEREACRLVGAYVEHWRSKPLPLCRAVEYEIGPAPLRPGDTFFNYRTARLDDVCNYPDALNKLCIGDLKTTSDSIAGCVNEYRQHGQFLLYSILWKMAKEGRALLGPIDGIMIDVLTKEKVPAFHRERIHVTDFQEQWYTTSMRKYLSEASQIQENSWTQRNPTACARAIGRGSYMCEYRPLCQYGAGHSGQFVDRSGGEPKKELIEI